MVTCSSGTWRGGATCPGAWRCSCRPPAGPGEPSLPCSLGLLAKIQPQSLADSSEAGPRGALRPEPLGKGTSQGQTWLVWV